MHVSFFRVAQARVGTLHRFIGIDRLLYPWPRGIDCLVHWSSPVRKLVFSQQYGPVRRSSPVRKLVATKNVCFVIGYTSTGNLSVEVLLQYLLTFLH